MEKRKYNYQRPFRCGLALIKDENYIYKFIDENEQFVVFYVE